MDNSDNKNNFTLEDDPFFSDPLLMYSSIFAEAANFESLFETPTPSQFCYQPPEPEVIPETTQVPLTSFTNSSSSPYPTPESSFTPSPFKNNYHPPTSFINFQSSPYQPPPPPPMILESSFGGRFGNFTTIQQQQMEMRQRGDDLLRKVLRIGNRNQHGGYKCTDCKREFLSPQALGGHKSSHTKMKRSDQEWARSLAKTRKTVGPPYVKISPKEGREGIGESRSEGEGDSEETASEDGSSAGSFA